MKDELVVAPICTDDTSLIWELVQTSIPENWGGLKLYMEKRKDVLDCAVRLALSIKQDPEWTFEPRFGDPAVTIYAGYPAVFRSEFGWTMIRPVGGRFIENGREITDGSVEIHIGQDMFNRFNTRVEFLKSGRVVKTIPIINYFRSSKTSNCIGRLLIPESMPEVMEGKADFFRIIKN